MDLTGDCVGLGGNEGHKGIPVAFCYTADPSSAASDWVAWLEI